MKKYTMSFRDAHEHKPAFPERTAKKYGNGMNLDATFQVWPNRQALARSIRMQQKRGPEQSDWIPIIKLTDGEGY